MMKLKHLLALAAVAVGSSAWAQASWTDKTSLITNPSFETGDAIANLTTSAWSTSGVDGWTILPTSASNSQVGIGNADSKIQGIAASSKAAVGDNYFYTRNNWNADVTFGVSQTIDAANLPVGLYMLTCKIKTSSSTPDKSKWTLSIQEGDKAAITNTNPGSAAEWLNCGVIINKESDDTNLTISATLLPGAANSGQHYVMMLDDFKLMYLSNADIANLSEENPLDVSGVIYNAGIYNANKANMPRGWTAFKSTRGNTNFTEGTGDTQLEGWSGGNLEIDYYQQIAGLPEGKYRMTAYCRDSNLRGAYAYIYNDVTDDKKTVPMTAEYSDITTPAIEVVGGNVNIGIAAKITGGSWVTGDNFRLEYCGKTSGPIDITAWSNAKNDAQDALALYEEKYAETERQAVIDAMTAEDPTSFADMSNMINDLNEKVSAYKEKAAYEKYLDGKKSLTVAIARIKEEYLHSSADLLKTDISKWTSSTFVANNGSEHWSGQKTNYYEQSGAQWGQDSWSISAENTLNLPAGKYAFVVTARASVGATSKMTVNETEVVLSNVGSVGRGVATDGEATYENTKTYARNNEGYGWEYAYVEFELAEAKDVTFKFEASANSRQQWVSIANPVLYYDDTAANNLDLVAAKAALLASANAVPVPTANIGDAAFQYPTADIEAIETAIETAKGVAESATSTIDDVNAAKDAIAEIKIPALKAPADGQKFHLNLKDRGTVTFIQNPAAQSGYGIPFMSKESDNYAQAFALIPVESEENDMYIMSFEDYDGETRYICNGSPYGAGTGAYGIRTITDEDKALVIKVVATAEEGVYNLMNTSTDGGYKKLGSNGGDFYTDDKYSNFTITVAQQATATLAISDAQYGTFIAPFNAEIPAGVTVYTCEEVDGNTLTLVEEEDAIKANTAYIVYAESEVKPELKGWGLATKDAYETGVLTGSYELASVEVGKYLLQNNGNVGFYLVAEEGFKIGANRCYLTAPKTAEEGKAFYFDTATAIEAINALAAGNVKAIYNAAGAAQKNLVRGLNIVKTADGKTVKVMVK